MKGVPPPTEAQCQATIVAAARLAGWRCHATRPAQSRSGRWSTPIQGDQGFVDLVLVKGTRLLFIELKRDKTGVMGPGQDDWLDALANVPGVRASVVWVPSEMDRLIAMLQRKQ